MGLLRRFFHRLRPDPDAGRPPEEKAARALIRAVDAGGIPLNPAKVNAIARALGLDVKPTAPVEETLERLRQAVKRMAP